VIPDNISAITVNCSADAMVHGGKSKAHHLSVFSEEPWPMYIYEKKDLPLSPHHTTDTQVSEAAYYC
jgi:hypothetical protein